MPSLSDIPTDVFSTISSFLPVESVTRLCQVSKRISEYVRADKWLWLECLRRDVISEGIELPKHRQSIENASANDVRSWVATAISLHRAYTSGGPSARVNSFAVDEDLETTWVKIIRGRWCLAAMSNNSQSYIGIWRTRSNGSVELENKFYLPGPVLDGAVDDDIADIRIAITVATTDPYIQILSLGMKDDETCLIPLEHLEGARHVLLLKDSIVGYATLHGDDTYPLLADWRIGATVRLCPALYNDRPHILLGNIHSVCHAMGIWRNHVVVVLNYSVEIFNLPSLGYLLPKAVQVDHFGCQSLYFPMMQDDSDSGWVGEAFLKESAQFPLDIMPNDKESSLRVSIRDRSLRYYALTLIQSPGDLGFSCQWDVNTSGNDALSSRTLKLCVGTSNEYQLRLTRAYGIQYPSILELFRLTRSPSKEIDAQCDMKHTFVLSTPGLPVLDLTTVMDFDDAAGLLLLGSCRGKICVIQFSDSTSQGLLNDFPPVLHKLASLPGSPIPLNLPYCYYRPDMIYERTVPTIVLEEALRSWEKACALPKVTSPPRWSSDWRKNRTIQNWVFPFPRWRTLVVDRVFHLYETYNRDLRARIGSHGDIVPIMYCESQHNFVIFKIARRIYYYNGGPFGEDDEPRIWALPHSEQDLSNPAVLAEVYQNRWHYGGPLCNRHYDVANTALLKINEEYMRLFDFLKTDDGRMELAKESLVDDTEPRTWLPAARKEIQKAANERWRESHRPWDDEDEYYCW